MWEQISEAAMWPIVALLAFVIFVFSFRHPISDAFARFRAISALGLRADLSGTMYEQANIQKSEEESATVKPPASPTSTPQNMPPQVALYDVRDKKTKETITSNIPNDKDQQLAWAIRLHTLASIELQHEANYRIMFGSQIALLKKINQFSFLSFPQARETHETLKESNPRLYSSMPFERWYNWLTTIGYMTLQRDDSGEMPETTMILTDFGRDFLIWMATKGVSEDKA
jgi:hypothetical protein